MVVRGRGAEVRHLVVDVGGREPCVCETVPALLHHGSIAHQGLHNMEWNGMGNGDGQHVEWNGVDMWNGMGWTCGMEWNWDEFLK